LRKSNVALLHLTLLPITSLLAVCLVPAAGAATATSHTLTEKIDESRLVTLPGNTRAAARNPLNDRGLVEDSLQLNHMMLLLNRPQEKEAELAALIDAMHTPGSPAFHKWLSAEEIGQRFGLVPNDIDTITTWLESHGFTVECVYANGVMIDFSGSAGQVREAFHTELHNLDVNGEKHIANISDPMIPAALAPAIHGIVSLNDFRPHAMHRAITPSYLDPQTGQIMKRDDALASGETQAVTAGDLATIYNMNPVFAAGYSGQGQTIVLIEDTNVYSTADWTTFRTTFGLAKYKSGSFVQVHPENCANPGVNSDDGEAILDAEYASASAPSAQIELASCADTVTTFGGLIALEKMLNSSKTPPAIVSISYGECESENGAAANASYSAVYQQAVAEGVSVFVAAGDEGADSCDAGANEATHGSSVSGFASTAYNVAVGGTDFGDTYAGDSFNYWNSTNTSTYESAKSYINEVPWNDSCAGVLLATAMTRSGVTYGSNGFCNSKTGEDFLTTTAASGGPSTCFSGAVLQGAANIGVTSGTCRGAAKPSWQSGVVGIPGDGVRDIPDVSLFAANGLWGHYYIYCYSDTANGGSDCGGAPSTWSAGGGTSFSAPVMAGIQALVNQKTGARQGNPNPTYYKLAAAEYGTAGSASCNSKLGDAVSSACTFYDVTQGDIDVNCTGSHNCYRPSGTNGVLSTSDTSYKPAYVSGTGFDFATGIGTVNVLNLVNNWNSANAPKSRKVMPIW
jgi:subtilase family serine protease